MALYASRRARERYGLVGKTSFSAGKIVLGSLAAARRLGEELAAVEDALPPMSAGELSAVARIEEVLQLIISRHLREREPAALERVLLGAQRALGGAETGRLLDLFQEDFSLTPDTGVVLRELLVWWALDENPAAASVNRRLLDGEFRTDDGRRRLLDALRDEATAAAGDAESLIDLLHAPARAAPDSLSGQLRFIFERWGDLLGINRGALLRSLDLLAEEARVALPGPGPVEVPVFHELDEEAEAYSPDRDWMDGVVLLARNVYVWLDQLSKRFARPIRRLDEIPQESLDELAARGFTGLWLIGVWERSPASERLKRLCGNPEAAASAYSLRGYRIAEELGGEPALEALARRAGRCGIRLAADMVPNHMGIDSDWVLEHPERFLSLAESPFAAYSFDGPDLSPDPWVGIYVEDHYYDRTDAAVVFKRVDRSTGEASFVYHGNDGTSTPWNDTAQLNFLLPETREAVIASILEVARRFPIIRFDAAMTLARRHIQRLWFPAPGSGGAIPSRAEHGLDAASFAELMPVEFWREVVDRVAEEAPDTLLLAEAFWLMEGYFVRSLGMHRVYNSAFMNLLRDGDNAKFRQLVKETLAFDPRILRRYVNFLTNPDEGPAIEQFGDGDRYFGACVLLATMPGLPMFGHGQMEGHTEKYGMEYRRAYYDETPSPGILARHEREIVPLLRRRRHFAGVASFELFDFVGAAGEVNEDVIACSNGAGRDAVLVLFNNSPHAARGVIGKPAPQGGRPGRTLGSILELGESEDAHFAFRDSITGLTFLRSPARLAGEGFEIELAGFGYHVLEDFRRLADDERIGRLARRLSGRGVADLDEALAELDLESAAEALRGLLTGLGETTPDGLGEPLRARLVRESLEVLGRLPGASAATVELPAGGAEALLAGRLEAVDSLRRLDELAPMPSPRMQAARDRFAAWLERRPEVGAGLAAAQIVEVLESFTAGRAAGFFRRPVDEALDEVGARLGTDEPRRQRLPKWVRLAVDHGWIASGELPEPRDLAALPGRWLEEPEIAALVEIAGSEAGESRGDLSEIVGWRLAAALAAAHTVADRQQRAELAAAWVDVMARLPAVPDGAQPDPAAGSETKTASE